MRTMAEMKQNRILWFSSLEIRLVIVWCGVGWGVESAGDEEHAEAVVGPVAQGRGRCVGGVRPDSYHFW